VQRVLSFVGFSKRKPLTLEELLARCAGTRCTDESWSEVDASANAVRFTTTARNLGVGPEVLSQGKFFELPERSVHILRGPLEGLANYKLGKGTYGEVLGVISPGEKPFALKRYFEQPPGPNTITAEEAWDNDRTLLKSFRKYKNTFKFVRVIAAANRLLKTEIVVGENLETLLNNPNLDPAVTAYLKTRYTTLANSLRTQLETAGWKVVPVEVPDAMKELLRGCPHYPMRLIRGPVERLAWIKPDNIIVDPYDLSMTMIDPL
jgi:hypothetical protein